jgi:hypothetical protein
MREAEALSDEMLIALSTLKSEILRARQNPEVEVHTGQQALLHLTEAEQLVTRASSQLFRTHSALSKVARETAGVDENIATVEDDGRQTASGGMRFTSAVPQLDDALP